MLDSGQERVVRVTFRCLLDDLATEVGPEPLRSALRTLVDDRSTDATHMLPGLLADIEHAVLDKANQLAADKAAPRERIVKIRDRHVVKVKTGASRGAMWEDDAGTWWLLAAGRRKDDTNGDFYNELERYSEDSAPIAPTEQDLEYQRLEAAYEQECEGERSAQAEVLGAVLAAARTPTSSAQIEIFGAGISISIDPDEGGLAVLEMSWIFKEFEQQDRFPMDVLAMVPGCECIEDWEYIPPLEQSDSPHAWYTYVTADWVQNLSNSAELDELLAAEDDWHPVNPSSDGTEHFSHFAKGSIVTLAYITGIEITALCGASIVAHRDYERFPVCPICNENLELLRSLRKPDET